jgi:hypothetical protein
MPFARCNLCPQRFFARRSEYTLSNPIPNIPVSRVAGSGADDWCPPPPPPPPPPPGGPWCGGGGGGGVWGDAGGGFVGSGSLKIPGGPVATSVGSIHALVRCAVASRPAVPAYAFGPKVASTQSIFAFCRARALSVRLASGRRARALGTTKPIAVSVARRARRAGEANFPAVSMCRLLSLRPRSSCCRVPVRRSVLSLASGIIWTSYSMTPLGANPSFFCGPDRENWRRSRKRTQQKEARKLVDVSSRRAPRLR